MKTSSYNPSTLETAFAKALENLKDEIQTQVGDITITGVDCFDMEDNPRLIFKFHDKDQDKHEIVVRIIQRSDDDL